VEELATGQTTTGFVKMKQKQHHRLRPLQKRVQIVSITWLTNAIKVINASLSMTRLSVVPSVSISLVWIGQMADRAAPSHASLNILAKKVEERARALRVTVRVVVRAVNRCATISSSTALVSLGTVVSFPTILRRHRGRPRSNSKVPNNQPVLAKMQ